MYPVAVIDIKPSKLDPGSNQANLIASEITQVRYEFAVRFNRQNYTGRFH
jgi:hypothetical protein